MATKKKKQGKSQKKALGDDPFLWMKEGMATQNNALSNDPEPGTSDSLQNDNISNVSTDKPEPTDTRVDATQNDSKANTTDSAEKNHFVLEPVITIAEVTELYKKLQLCLSQSGDLEIDASQVHMIDTAGLQLLLVFFMELQRQERNVNWHSPSSTFLQTASLIGLSKPLGLNN